MVELSWAEADATVKWLDVDALMREGNTGTSELTENPIELGSDVTDHIRDKSDVLTLEFVITNTPIRVPTTHMQGVGGSVRKVGDDGGSALEFDLPFDRIKVVWDDLNRVRKAGLLWRIETQVRVYDDFQIESLSFAKDSRSGSSAAFTMQMRRARFVATRIAPIPQRRRVTQQRVNAGNQPARQPRESAAIQIRNRAVRGS